MCVQLSRHESLVGQVEEVGRLPPHRVELAVARRGIRGREVEAHEDADAVGLLEIRGGEGRRPVGRAAVDEDRPLDLDDAAGAEDDPAPRRRTSTVCATLVCAALLARRLDRVRAAAAPATGFGSLPPKSRSSFGGACARPARQR